MTNPRTRPFIYAGTALVAVWLLAMGGFIYIRGWKMTADKVNRYQSTMDLKSLPVDSRARALRKFEDMINALPPDERRQWRATDDWKRAYADMTDDERSQFIDATLPSGFKQMMDSFAALPEDQRKKVVDDAIKNLKQGHLTPDTNTDGSPAYGTNGPPTLTPELEQKVRQLGLKTYYSQSSAEIKVELAPLMEEIQKQIQNGGTLR